MLFNESFPTTSQEKPRGSESNPDLEPHITAFFNNNGQYPLPSFNRNPTSSFPEPRLLNPTPRHPEFCFTRLHSLQPKTELQRSEYLNSSLTNVAVLTAIHQIETQINQLKQRIDQLHSRYEIYIKLKESQVEVARWKILYQAELYKQQYMKE